HSRNYTLSLHDALPISNMTKQQHLESLAEWAVNKRNSSDPYFLIGLFLEYDGQAARAEKFFQKANELAGISGGHIAVFLDPVTPDRKSTRLNSSHVAIS